MGGILNSKAAWFAIGAAAMYFAYPYVAAALPFGRSSNGS